MSPCYLKSVELVNSKRRFKTVELGLKLTRRKQETNQTSPILPLRFNGNAVKRML